MRIRRLGVAVAVIAIAIGACSGPPGATSKPPVPVNVSRCTRAPWTGNTTCVIGSAGVLETPIFSDSDVIVTRGTERQVHPVRYPPHVHQPLIQTIVDELAGTGRCPSSGESGARASWVLDRCLAG